MPLPANIGDARLCGNHPVHWAQLEDSETEGVNLAPAVLQMLNALLHLFYGQGRAELEHPNVVWLNERLESGEIDRSRAGRTMIPARKLNVVNVESGQ